MVRQTLLGLVLIAAVFVIVVVTQPARFHIERSLVIAAPPEAVFAEVYDLHAWRSWSPWESLDPQMERSYAGPSRGVGASYAWKSRNGKVGQGRMTIESCQAPVLVGLELDLVKPFPASNEVTFVLLPMGDATRVTWAMDGRNGFLGKAFHLVANVDRLVGGDFERGLAGLKQTVEAQRHPPYAPR